MRWADYSANADPLFDALAAPRTCDLLRNSLADLGEHRAHHVLVEAGEERRVVRDARLVVGDLAEELHRTLAAAGGGGQRSAIAEHGPFALAGGSVAVA